MDFLNVTILWHLLWLVPLFVILVWRTYVIRERVLSLIFGHRAGNPEYVKVSKTKRIIKYILFFVTLIFLFLAAARPYWGMQILPYGTKSRDILILLDVSKSMLSEDVKPSRLKHAKWILKHIIQTNEGDRFGLVAFAGSAFLECPLTTDQTSLLRILDEMNTESIPLGGTNIERAINTALKAFKGAEGNFRAILLVTDGDELYGNSLAAIDKLKERKIPLFIMGIGNPESPGLIVLKQKDGTVKFLRDSKGNLVKAKLNEHQLEQLATATGGIYVRSTTTNTGINKIESRIKQLVPKEFGKGKQTRPIERFHLPLAVGLLLFFIWLLISERPMRNNINTASIKLLVMTGLIAQLSLQSTLVNAESHTPQPGIKPKTSLPEATDMKNNNGNAHIAQKDAAGIYNMALKLQKKNDPHAFELYEKAINLAKNNREVLAKSYHNAGVIIHKKARNSLMQSYAMARQTPDAALKQIESAESIMDKVEDMYRNALSNAADISQPKAKKYLLSLISANQQRLLTDRQLAKRLKDLIKQLKKKQEQAKKKLKQAKQQQKKENQQKQSEGNAKQKTDEALKAVKELRNAAKQIHNKNIEKAAEKAEEEIKKAQKAQNKKQGKKAEKHLKQALKYLNALKQNRQKKQDKNKTEAKNEKCKKKQKKQKQKKQDKQDKKLKKAKLNKGHQIRKQQKPKEKLKRIDKAQAEALLDLMANQEKTLREKLREQQKARVKKVEKDW